MSRRKTLLFVVNQLAFFRSHRWSLAVAAKEAGYDVHVATGPCRDSDSIEIAAAGMAHYTLPLQRGGLNPWGDIQLLWSLWRLCHRLRPQVVHLITIKPVIYGGLAARWTRVPNVVMAVSGLGFVFIRSGYLSTILRGLVGALYRCATGGGRVHVIVQNRDDQQLFAKLTGLQSHQMSLIPGSGIHLQDFPCLPEPQGEAVVVMASRLLWDKGVAEFIEAARLLKADGVVARFCLVGDLDPENPSSCKERDLLRWKSDGYVEVMGHRNNIAEVFSQSHVVVLPSYREGLPKVLIEAAACGRAVVTTNVPGCRDAIQQDVSGLVVPARDAHALADAMRNLIQDAARRQAMGRAGRVLAEYAFDIKQVVNQHLLLYGK